jgi:hypothetical protein
VILAGCASNDHAVTATPRRVPAGAAAIVGAVPVTLSSLDHWLAIAAHDPTTSGSPGRIGPRAVQRTVTFLVRAQWLLQESQREGISATISHKLAAEVRRQAGMTRSDAVFQARLDMIAEALQRRHGAVSVSPAHIRRYYIAHRSQFASPALRDTKMIVTGNRASALQAKAALAAGESWAAVAKRWSIDSSALNGAAFTVVEGVQSEALVHAVFSARPAQITGPVRAILAARPTTSDYYVFMVTGARSASTEPLAKVSEQIRQTLTEQERQRTIASFVSQYESRWRAHTLCAPAYLVPQCSNYQAPSAAR